MQDLYAAASKDSVHTQCKWHALTHMVAKHFVWGRGVNEIGARNVPTLEQRVG